jgi:HAD superfamily hydrolase (TIGR01509 family)
VIKSVIFDCFGVLVPDKLTLLFSTYSLSSEQKIPISDAVKAYDLGYADFSVVIEAVVATTDLTTDQAEVWFDEKNLHIDRTLLETIRELKTQGFYTGVLSNTGVASFNKLFSLELQAETFVDVVLSGAVGLIKPDPAIFELSLQKSGVPAHETLFIDDRLHNVTVAEQMGMRAYLYTTYEAFVHDHTELFQR